ncbi:hypothetical protein EPUS_07138 [Endocarpon pusillum Z07020]|uniref:Lethal giant larvae (Lgl)-like C-terminal domain-containing protein n=1 Tax=Endocarpon pusillum (strain Z07020 / HMAS-L-300199) TaxID=1263415 RepID=U1HF74_ENDPU|nr:uncharacterized protein EPUS_07138 [Endocarpon pusillum Z07020]ERF68720.1 hypothetical protein EPUS_07138 [Endocarpon pusillum Z07020]
MAHLLRGKQAGVQKDLSSGLTPELFAIDDLVRYGVNSQLAALAYDPVQSLLAVGTNDSQFGAGLIYVYGQKRVCMTLSTPRRASIRQLQFSADKLISWDSKNDVCVFSLETGRLVASYAPPGHVTAVLTDPSLDYCFIGMQNGDIVTYDLDRDTLTSFRIPNLLRQVNPRSKLVPVVSMQLHPRDIGTLLIGYTEGAALFSFKQNKATKFFQYEIPRGAPGGDPDVAGLHEVRRPRLSHAVWHPTGTFILTAHDDSSLVFWDPRDGRIVEARTIQTTNIHVPGGGATTMDSSPGIKSMKQPYFDIAWCSKENPDDTGLLIAGGTPTSCPTPGLTFFDLGPTPNYQTSSWDVLANYFRVPRRTHILPTPPNAEIVKFLLIPRSTPHYAGSNDPIAVITLLSSGELITLSFPSGNAITPTNQLHVSLTFVHPFVTRIALACVDRTRWLGTRESRQHGPNFLLGGAEETKPLKRHENRNIVQAAHADGTVRVWDAAHGDEIENSAVLQIDLARAVGRFEDIDVTQMSMSGATGELSIGLQSGEVAIFRLNQNPQSGREPPPPKPNAPPGRLTNIVERADPVLKEGLLPLTLLNEQQGPVTALKHSDVGFVAVGFRGSIAVIDLRGPAIIHTQLLSDLAPKNKKASIRRSNSHASGGEEVPTAVEFGVMTLDGDDYSSILLFVGTSLGHLETFKILPASNGTYSVAFAGVASLGDPIISISPINADSGFPAYATQSAVGSLKTGNRINGVLVVTTTTGVQVFKPASARGAHNCHNQLQRPRRRPSLKEIGSAKISHVLDVKRFREAIITPTGDILGWTGPSELALSSTSGAPAKAYLAWISGTQYITPSDMDILIGGPDRPPSKRMLTEMREAESAARAAARSGKPPPPGPNGEQEGYWAYMQRQVQERTERLGLMDDQMGRLEETSSGWANDVGKFVQKQKRQMVLGAIGSKLGF